MSWHFYDATGALIERGDDEARAVYDGAGAKIRDYTEAENAAADVSSSHFLQHPVSLNLTEL